MMLMDNVISVVWGFNVSLLVVTVSRRAQYTGCDEWFNGCRNIREVSFEKLAMMLMDNVVSVGWVI